MDHKVTLSRKLGSLFKNESLRNDVVEILENYGKENHEQEASRVKLAVLKLANTDINEIRKYVDMAKQDYRDILAWAEYPRQSKKWSMPDGSKKKTLIEADRVEYEEWLNT